MYKIKKTHDLYFCYTKNGIHLNKNLNNNYNDGN